MQVSRMPLTPLTPKTLAWSAGHTATLLLQILITEKGLAVRTRVVGPRRNLVQQQPPIFQQEQLHAKHASACAALG